jgi:anti-anti-sigma regulatory factor
VMVDVEHVSFMDSSGLALLAMAYRQCQQRDGEVCVIHPQPFVARTLGIAGLDQVVTVVNDCREVRELYNRMSQLDAAVESRGSRRSLDDSASASA